MTDNEKLFEKEITRAFVERIADVLDRWDPANNPEAHREFDTVAIAQAIAAEVFGRPTS